MPTENLERISKNRVFIPPENDRKKKIEKINQTPWMSKKSKGNPKKVKTKGPATKKKGFLGYPKRLNPIDRNI